MVTGQGTGKAAGPQDGFTAGEAVRVGPLSWEPSRLWSCQLRSESDPGGQTPRGEMPTEWSLWRAVQHRDLIVSAERHLVYYACCDVANVYPVSPINVIHSTIAREAIELPTKEVVMDHNGNFNAQQDPLLEW